MLRRTRRRRIEEITQSSLPDLAFLLLIFFITSMDFTIEQGLPFVLPSARRSVTLQVEPSEVFRIQGYPDGRITVDGQPVDVDQIGALLVARNRQRRSAGEAELIVVIETHPDSEYQQAVAILDQVRAADSRRVSLQMIEEGS